jgi:hypothetical protein
MERKERFSWVLEKRPSGIVVGFLYQITRDGQRCFELKKISNFVSQDAFGLQTEFSAVSLSAGGLGLDFESLNLG